MKTHYFKINVYRYSTSEELSFRFGLNAVLRCGRDDGAAGVVASPVLSPNGLVYVGSSDRYFYAIHTLTGEIAWRLYTDSPIGSSAAVDSNGGARIQFTP